MKEIERQKEIKRLKEELGHGFGDYDPVKLAIANRIKELQHSVYR